MSGRTVADVCQQLEIKPHVLRYWEEQIPWLAPERTLGGHRVYNESHIHLLFRFKFLLEERGYTLQGAAEQIVRENTGDGVGIKSRLHPLRFELLELRRGVSALQQEITELIPNVKASKQSGNKHPVDDYLPGIAGLPQLQQLQLLQDYTAFRPEFRLPLVQFLYSPSGTAMLNRRADFRNQMISLGTRDDLLKSWTGDGHSSLLIVSPVFTGEGLEDDLEKIRSLLADSMNVYIVLLLFPGPDIVSEQLNDISDHPNVTIRPLPVFPDISRENRLLLQPEANISRYFPGPGIAVQSVLADESLKKSVPPLAQDDAILWYCPVGLAEDCFSLPPEALIVWMRANTQAITLLALRQNSGLLKLKPAGAFRLKEGVCQLGVGGLENSGVIAERILTVNRLDQLDDINYQEVRRVRSSLSDIALHSHDVTIAWFE